MIYRIFRRLSFFTILVLVTREKLISLRLVEIDRNQKNNSFCFYYN